jgi:hypothetical protein
MIRVYGPEAHAEFEVIDHLRQLTAALVAGSIGFEWWTDLTRRELARVGW